MNEKIKNFKQQLAHVFDDDLRTEQWHNSVDYTIMGLIALSTLGIFLSTYDGIAEKYGLVLDIIDYFTLAVFTIEVSLRIWCADLIDDKYKGVWGRVRYCFSFYGLMDVLSTYTFYVALFFPIPYMTFKVLRVARLFRVFRYVKAFNVLSRAFKSKKDEMWVSLEFLCIVTLMLSFILYFVEHEAQPDVYNNGWTSVVWAFAQYIGDPGGFADTPPVTLWGRIIACIIGVLGIAIFAVPAGLIGSAFSDVMAEDQRNEDLKEFENRIVHSFKFDKDQHHTGLFCVPRYQELSTIVTGKFITEADVIETIKESECLHLYNLAKAVNKAEKPEDKMVVINYYKNRPYGCCIDRGSRITIVSTSGFTEPMTGWFAYHVAKLGGFNYVAKEIEVDPDNPVTYYNITDENGCPNLRLFLDDINRLSNRPNAWVIPFLGAEGTADRPSQWHFCYASTKHDATYDDPNKILVDTETFEQLYQTFSQHMGSCYNQHCDKNEWYAIGKDNIARHLACPDSFTLRIESRLFVFDDFFLQYAKDLADILNATLEPEISKTTPPEMLARPKGHDFGFGDYVD